MPLTALALALAPLLGGADPGSVDPVEPTPPDTWYVDALQPPPGTGTQSDPFYSLTYAVAQPWVASGDRLLVAPGDYRNESVNFLGKNLRVVSQAGPAATRIIAPNQTDPEHPFPALRLENGESEVLLEGFTITGGTGSRECTGFTDVTGGAASICGANARFVNCVFTGNTADRGGAIYVRAGRASFKDTAFLGPGSDALGEAIYALRSSVVMENCSVTDMRIAPVGFAQGQSAVILDQSTATFMGCNFERNSTRLFGAHVWSRSSDVNLIQCSFSEATGYAGAALAALGGTFRMEGSKVEGNNALSAPGAGLFASSAEVAIDRCIFENNRATGSREGGGIALSGGSIDIKRSLFASNRAAAGGAIYLSNGAQMAAQSTDFLWNEALYEGGALHCLDGEVRAETSTFMGNAALAPVSIGGAVLGAAQMKRCTFYANRAGLEGGAAAGGAALLGSIVWRNAPVDLDPTCAARLSIVGSPGGASLQQVSSEDPLFFAEFDLHLMPMSPAIDALPFTFGMDPDGSRMELGALTYNVNYCGESCAGEFGGVGCAGTQNSSGYAATPQRPGKGRRATSRPSCSCARPGRRLRDRGQQGGAGRRLSARHPDPRGRGGGVA